MTEATLEKPVEAKRTSRTTKKTAASTEPVAVIWRPAQANPPRGKNSLLTLSRPKLTYREYKNGTWVDRVEAGMRVTLKPGTNLISPSKYQELKEHPDLDRYVVQGAVDVKEISPDATYSENTPSTIGNMSIKDAVDIVEGLGASDLPKLHEWQKKEKRTKVLSAISARITNLSKGNVA